MNLHSARPDSDDRLGNAERPSLHTRGRAVARLLSGAWREADKTASAPTPTSPPADAAGSDRSRLSDLSNLSDLSDAELTGIQPLVCRLGAGALAWWQLRNTPLNDCPAALRFREVYRRHRLSALLHEREVAHVFSLLHAEGIEAVLVKGWAIARRYPDRALRPYGDLDICVRPDQFAHAARLVERIATLEGPFVDLHRGFTRIGQTKTVKSRESGVDSLSALRRLWTQDSGLRTRNKTVKSRESGVHSLSALRRLWTQDSGLRTQTNGDWDELYERSKVVQCPTDSGLKTQNSGLSLSVPVRVLCDEDHLRLLCLHLLRSGAHRPAWLCDVALLIEQVQSPRSNVQSQQNAGSAGVPPAGLGSRTLDIGRWTLDSAFDWDVCLGRNRRDANWVGVVVRLAHELLGADISQTPFAERPLPRWLVPAVLEQWGGRRVSGRQSTVRSPSDATRLWTPDWGLWTDLYRRWDNPIRSTAAVGGRFDERSRLPYRLLESAMRLPELWKAVASGQ